MWVQYVEVVVLVDTQRLIVACHQKSVWCVIQHYRAGKSQSFSPDLVLPHFKLHTSFFDSLHLYHKDCSNIATPTIPQP